MLENESNNSETIPLTAPNAKDKNQIVQLIQDQETKHNSPVSCKSFWRLSSLIPWKYFSFGAFYFLEYLSISILSSHIAKQYKKSPSDSLFVLFMFESLQCAYQTGIYISRSSLVCFKVNKYYIPLAVLFIFTFLLFLQNIFPLTLPIWVVYTNLTLIGLLGGLLFANLSFLIIKDPQVSLNEKVIFKRLSSIENSAFIYNQPKKHHYTRLVIFIQLYFLKLIQL